MAGHAGHNYGHGPSADQIHFITSRLEDITFLADAGESEEATAQRLGIPPNGLYCWLLRQQRVELWDQLCNNGASRPAHVMSGRVNYPQRRTA